MIKLQDDKLERNELLDSIFNIVDYNVNTEKGITIVLNGIYGSGKTTVLNFIEERNNRDNKFNVIRYNVWENNIFENPTIPLLYCISELKDSENNIKDTAKKILKNMPKIIAGTISNAYKIDLTSLFDNSENFFDDFKKYKDSVVELKTILTDYCKKKKTILLVDELDRCLPSYQIKALESIYHLLNIPNLVTIIALDRGQLECSIKNQFGDNQNTFGYLSKFIDYEINLLEGNTYSYITSLMNLHCGSDDEYAQRWIVNMFKRIKLPIRDCQNIIQELNIFCHLERTKRNHDNPYWYALLIAFILLVKRLDNNIYMKYFCVVRQDNYSLQKADLDNTFYMKFLNEIKGTKIEEIIHMLVNERNDDNYGVLFMTHLINFFDNIENIDEQSISKYLGPEIARYLYNSIRNDFLRYPYGTNELIKRIQMIK